MSNHTLNEHFFKKNITFTSKEQMCALIESIKPLGVNYFTYDASFFDLSHIRLTTHPDWIEYYYRQDLYKHAVFEANYQLIQDGCIYWKWLNPYPIYMAASNFMIDNGLTMVRKNTEKANYYHFGFEKQINLFDDSSSERLAVLNRFIDYFHNKLQNTIQKAHQERITLDLFQKIHEKPNNKMASFSLQKEQLNQLNQQLKQSTSKIILTNEMNYLTKTERRVLEALVQHGKAKIIADQLNLSQRTIEEHIKRIKSKLQCKNLFELGMKVAKNFSYLVEFE